MKSAVQIMSTKKELRHEIGKILSEEKCQKLWKRAGACF